MALGVGRVELAALGGVDHAIEDTVGDEEAGPGEHHERCARRELGDRRLVGVGVLNRARSVHVL